MTRLTDALTTKLIDFVDRILHREPTLLVEIGTAFTTMVWGICMLIPGQLFITPAIDATMQRFPEEAQGAVALGVAVNQLLALTIGSLDWRGWSAFASSIWLGWLAGAILAADPHLPGGYVYLGMACVSLLPFWRIFIDKDSPT